MYILNYRHTCVLPNHQFYFYILAVSSALLCIYILCNLYNLVRRQKPNISPRLFAHWRNTFYFTLNSHFLINLQVWIIWPQMGRMFRIIRKYRYTVWYTWTSAHAGTNCDLLEQVQVQVQGVTVIYSNKY